MRNSTLLALLVLLVILGSIKLFAASEKRKLNSQEAYVMLQKGTERPFTGEYWNHKKKGVYRCKQCDTPLFRSDSKFDSRTGWPSFDEALPGAVKEIPDKDGYRTEIVCAKCGGHLGHVFKGEGFTKKGVRHCVNSVCLAFEPKPNLGRAIFAGGCFWGVEYWLEKEPGVIKVTSGYTGGEKKNPTYREVSSHLTKHIEAVEVTFDKDKTSFDKLARLFFEIHDPTQVNRQGPDRGYQYSSAVFYVNENQKKVTERLIAQLKKRGYKVVTMVRPATTFWPAETYHQDYYSRKGSVPYCHAYQSRF